MTEQITEQKAKEMLQAKLTCMELESLACIEKGCNMNCTECSYNYAQGTRGEHKKALDMAIKALEKQIPKKVNLRHIRKYDGFDDGECPTCGNSVLRDGFSNDVYCDDCGQKLDWSDEDDGED